MGWLTKYIHSCFSDTNGYEEYELKFKKTYQPVDYMSWKEVSDASLINVLLNLQEKYDFDIVSTKFGNCYCYSWIRIQCKKEDKSKIFSEYCVMLDGKIESISF